MSYDAYIGKTQTRTDEVSPRLLTGMAATLGVARPTTLPPLWHWMLFQDWVPPDQLGADGHPRRGGFLPPVHDLPRRMWAGGRVRLRAPLQEGAPVTRTSTILAIDEKQGGSGRLVFVTVRHVIEGPTGPAIEEEQDIVYRGTEGAAVKPAPAVTDRVPPGGGITTEVLPDPVLLFRYSALTGNGHRIHYDMDYVRDVEGYPGLVVHGPLQATWLAGLLGQRPITRFSFRGRRPAFHGLPLTLEARPGGSGYNLRTLDGSGAICMEAQAHIGAGTEGA
ncbi:MAG: MaoC family dehydratase N-terminal domain-containing protein [Acetobacteraceae bacterium]|nr:MaoC family dehydratase N-terminal domain-containing protein [Acetobacteraceae bacterium]